MFSLPTEEVSYLCSLRDLVHILRFNDGFEVIFQDFGKVILQL